MSATAWARQQQLESGPEDDRLRLRAQAAHGGRKHWWGRRSRDQQQGAFCYLCETFITTWDGRYPITDAARATIALHRSEHVQALPSERTPRHGENS